MIKEEADLFQGIVAAKWEMVGNVPVQRHASTALDGSSLTHSQIDIWNVQSL